MGVTIYLSAVYPDKFLIIKKLSNWVWVSTSWPPILTSAEFPNLILNPPLVFDDVESSPSSKIKFSLASTNIDAPEI